VTKIDRADGIHVAEEAWKKKKENAPQNGQEEEGEKLFGTTRVNDNPHKEREMTKRTSSASTMKREETTNTAGFKSSRNHSQTNNPFIWTIKIN
jgi:hypothetical protein